LTLHAAPGTLSGVTQLRARLEQATWTSVVVAGLGLALLLTTAWVLFLTTDVGNLVDAYQAREEPWTSIGVVLTLVGASAAALFAAAGTLARVDLVRSVLLIPPVVVALGWWAAAVDLVNYPGFAGPDPIGFAFAFPIPAAVGLLVPAAVMIVLAEIDAPERRPPLRMRAVHDQLPVQRAPDPDVLGPDQLPVQRAPGPDQPASDRPRPGDLDPDGPA
jgi:hypothetical protein